MRFQLTFRMFLGLLIISYAIAYSRAVLSIQEHEITNAMIAEIESKDELSQVLGADVRVENVSSLLFKRGSQGGVYIASAHVCGAKTCKFVRARSEPLVDGKMKIRFVRFEKQ